MNLREKLDRYASKPRSTKARPVKKRPVSSAAEWEHSRHVFPPAHVHGNIRIGSLGGSTSKAARMLTYSTPALDVDFERIAFIDTETTGLSGGSGTCAFLVGVGYHTADGFVVEQFLMKDFPAESDMLQNVLAALKGFAVIASYNGRAFDIPILDARLLLNGIRKRLADMPQLDLLHTARRIWKHRLSDCSLTSIEEHVLGHKRTDDIEGWMIPQTFFEYLRSGDGTLLDPIIKHNQLDILSLACLARVVFNALDAPHEAQMEHGLDWFGLGTLFEKHRRVEEAVLCFDRAIAVGVPGNVKPRCVRSLSLAHKRNGDWDDAVSLWNKSVASNDNMHTLYALEELAKFYEHRRRDYPFAREFCRRAIAILEIWEATSDLDLTLPLKNFEYRLKRIEEKMRKNA